MKYILTPNEMRRADSIAINEFNIPGIILMENAARSSSMIIRKLYEEKKIPFNEIIFFCGSGNNGGDGFAIARHLFEDFDVKIFWIGSKEKMSDETKTNFKSVEKLKIPIYYLKEQEDLNSINLNNKCIIDALIGVGGSENIKGLALDILKKIDSSDSFKISIDVPTGLNSETGIAHPHCVKANITITMFAIKTGMLLNDGIDVCGQIHQVYLGAPNSIVRQLSKINILEDSDIRNLIPKRRKRSSKFDYGKIIIIAGSKRYPGAAALTANAAIKSGAGLVYLLSPTFHSALLPEVIPLALPYTDEGTIALKAYESIIKELDRASVLVIGPGLGENKETIELVKRIIFETEINIPTVIDADGLRVIKNNTTLRKNLIITPHCGEFSRITGIDRKEIEFNTYNIALKYAKELNCIILIKNVPSIITDGNISYFNINGNPGMSTGGSGDVLTGIISGLLSIGLSPIESASVGAYIHSKAGDYYAENNTQETLTATSLIESLSKVFPK